MTRNNKTILFKKNIYVFVERGGGEVGFSTLKLSNSKSFEQIGMKFVF